MSISMVASTSTPLFDAATHQHGILRMMRRELSNTNGQRHMNKFVDVAFSIDQFVANGDESPRAVNLIEEDLKAILDAPVELRVRSLDAQNIKIAFLGKVAFNTADSLRAEECLVATQNATKHPTLFATKAKPSSIGFFIERPFAHYVDNASIEEVVCRPLLASMYIDALWVRFSASTDMSVENVILEGMTRAVSVSKHPSAWWFSSNLHVKRSPMKYMRCTPSSLASTSVETDIGAELLPLYAHIIAGGSPTRTLLALDGLFRAMTLSIHVDPFHFHRRLRRALKNPEFASTIDASVEERIRRHVVNEFCDVRASKRKRAKKAPLSRDGRRPRSYSLSEIPHTRRTLKFMAAATDPTTCFLWLPDRDEPICSSIETRTAQFLRVLFSTDLVDTVRASTLGTLDALNTFPALAFVYRELFSDWRTTAPTPALQPLLGNLMDANLYSRYCQDVKTNRFTVVPVDAVSRRSIAVSLVVFIMVYRVAYSFRSIGFLDIVLEAKYLAWIVVDMIRDSNVAIPVWLTHYDVVGVRQMFDSLRRIAIIATTLCRNTSELRPPSIGETEWSLFEWFLPAASLLETFQRPTAIASGHDLCPRSVSFSLVDSSPTTVTSTMASGDVDAEEDAEMVHNKFGLGAGAGRGAGRGAGAGAGASAETSAEASAEIPIARALSGTELVYTTAQIDTHSNVVVIRGIDADSVREGLRASNVPGPWTIKEVPIPEADISDDDDDDDDDDRTSVVTTSSSYVCECHLTLQDPRGVIACHIDAMLLYGWTSSMLCGRCLLPDAMYHQDTAAIALRIIHSNNTPLAVFPAYYLWNLFLPRTSKFIVTNPTLCFRGDLVSQLWLTTFERRIPWSGIPNAWNVLGAMVAPMYQKRYLTEDAVRVLQLNKSWAAIMDKVNPVDHSISTDTILALLQTANTQATISNAHVAAVVHGIGISPVPETDKMRLAANAKGSKLSTLDELVVALVRRNTHDKKLKLKPKPKPPSKVALAATTDLKDNHPNETFVPTFTSRYVSGAVTNPLLETDMPRPFTSPAGDTLVAFVAAAPLIHVNAQLVT